MALWCLDMCFVERLFALPDIKVTALDCLNNIVKFVAGIFVLDVNQYLSVLQALK